MRIQTIGLTLMLLASASAGASESDKLCLYLGSLANQATKADTDLASNPKVDTKQKLQELMDLAAQIQRLDAPTKDAIERHLTFEQFQTKMAVQNVHVSDFYKSSYLGMYIHHYCGQESEQSSLIINNGKITDSSRKVTVEKQFDPSDDPYYQQMKSDPTVVK